VFARICPVRRVRIADGLKLSAGTIPGRRRDVVSDFANLSVILDSMPKASSDTCDAREAPENNIALDPLS